jgi:hypothetical protein
MHVKGHPAVDSVVAYPVYQGGTGILVWEQVSGELWMERLLLEEFGDRKKLILESPYPRP